MMELHPNGREFQEAFDRELEEEFLKHQKINKKPLKNKGTTFVRKSEKIGRNDLCPCGSKNKFKACCLPNFERMQANYLKAVNSKQSSNLKKTTDESKSS